MSVRRSTPQAESGESGRARPRGGGAGRADHLSAGALPLAIFLPGEDHENFELAEEIPGPVHGGAGRSRAGDRRGDRRLAFREARRPGFTTTPPRSSTRTASCSGNIARCTSRTIPLLREVLLHAGRPRFSGLADAARQDRRLRLLGSMVSRGRAPHGAARRGDSLLSDGDRLASERESEVRLRPAFRLGNDPAQPCHRERLLRRRGRIASATKRRTAATGSNSGAKVSSSRRAARFSPRRASSARKRIFADVEWKRVNEHRTHWPFLRDRRIDAYAGIEQRLLD